MSPIIVLAAIIVSLLITLGLLYLSYKFSETEIDDEADEMHFDLYSTIYLLKESGYGKLY